jgi:hypothetical protein
MKIMDNIFKEYIGYTLSEWITENDEFFNGGGINNPHACKLEFYHYFLQQTDFVSAKIIDAQILGVECKDYTNVLNARAYAREQINILEAIIAENNEKIRLNLI